MFLNNSAIFGTTLLADLGYLRKMSASTRNPGVETLSIETLPPTPIQGLPGIHVVQSLPLMTMTVSQQTKLLSSPNCSN